MLYYWKRFYFNKIVILKIQVLLVKRFLLVCEVLMTKIRLWNFEKMVWNLNCDHFTYISFKKYLGSKDLKTSCILVHPTVLNHVDFLGRKNCVLSASCLDLLECMNKQLFGLFSIKEAWVNFFKACMANWS